MSLSGSAMPRLYSLLLSWTDLWSEWESTKWYHNFWPLPSSLNIHVAPWGSFSDLERSTPLDSLSSSKDHNSARSYNQGSTGTKFTSDLAADAPWLLLWVLLLTFSSPRAPAVSSFTMVLEENTIFFYWVFFGTDVMGFLVQDWKEYNGCNKGWDVLMQII